MVGLKTMNKLQQNFPALKRDKRHKKAKKIIYFDNACQTLLPKQALKAINDYYKKYPACAGRSNYDWSNKVTQKVWKTRQIIANFIGAKAPEEIIFTKNTTEAINLIAHSLHPKKVLTSDKEHNSNLAPWQNLKNCSYNVFKFDLSDLKEKLKRDNIDLVSCVWTSNLDGSSIDIKKVINLAHHFNAKVLIDAAQTIPHKKINTAKLDIDFLAFSGHKTLGPSGTGVLYIKKELQKELKPFLFGGGMVANAGYNKSKILPPPEKFEAGLQNYAGILGLGAGIKYLNKIINNLPAHEKRISTFITKELNKIPHVHLIGSGHQSIISFYSDKISSNEIALLLNEKNIAVRSGKFCVHAWFKANKIKDAVRISLHAYNTITQAKKFIKELKSIFKQVK